MWRHMQIVFAGDFVWSHWTLALFPITLFSFTQQILTHAGKFVSHTCQWLNVFAGDFLGLYIG